MRFSFYIIIGNGALGTALAAHLQTLGFQPRLLSRSGATRHKACLENGPRGTESLLIPELHPDEALQAGAILVAVKAYQLREALSHHLPELPPSLPVLCLGNGAIEEEIRFISENFPDRRFRVGVTTIAVTKLSENRYAYRNPEGEIHWGPLCPKEDSISLAEQQLVDSSPSLFHWENNPLPFVRRKWLFNTVLNSLAGAERAPTNGTILSDLHKLRLIFREAYALGITNWGDWEQDEDELFQQLIRLVKKTESNENSMAQDVRQGRETETDYLAGLARSHQGFPLLKKLDQILRRS